MSVLVHFAVLCHKMKPLSAPGELGEEQSSVPLAQDSKGGHGHSLNKLKPMHRPLSTCTADERIR